MRKITILWALTALLAIFAFPAAVSATWGPGCQDSKQYAVKVADNSDGSGATDYECGNVWELGDAAVADTNLGNTTGTGSIENMNDRASWMKAWNNNGTYGMCVTIYKDADMNGRDYDFWVAPGDVLTVQLGVFSDMISSISGWNPIAGKAGCNDQSW